jgi:hypothetical protein
LRISAPRSSKAVWARFGGEEPGVKGNRSCVR